MKLVQYMTALCVQCQSPAYVHAEWQVGGNTQEADLCARCMDEVWRMFGRSTLFNFRPASLDIKGTDQ